MSSWSIFNVADALTWSGKAHAIVAVDSSSRPAAGQMLMFPQTNSAPSRSTADVTADPLLRSGAIAIRNADLPDLSTPMLGHTTPAQQAAQLSGLMAKSSLQNDYFSDDVIGGSTDWLLSFPTLRYSVALNYDSGLPEYTTLSPAYFDASNTRLEGDAATPIYNGSIDTRRVCLTDVTYHDSSRGGEVSTWGEGGGGVTMIPPWDHRRPRPCGPVHVMSINAGAASQPSALKARTSRKDLQTDFFNGWVEAVFFDINQAGIPVIGGAFSSATSTNIGAGISGNFGLVWEHRYVRPDQVIR